MSKRPAHLTPDGRYLVIVGSRGPRLWRTSHPNLSESERQKHVDELMQARRAVRFASSDEELAAARRRVNAAKVSLGERGPVWWTDGAPDLNRRLVKGSCYEDWWVSLSADHG